MSRPKVPEIVTRVVTQLMPPSELEARIVEFLGRHTMCVLATCADNVPRATPIEYRSEGLVIHLMGEPGTKLDNIRSNPRVSVGIYDDRFARTHDWLDVSGLQITGTATLAGPGEPDFVIAAGLFDLSAKLPPQWKGSMIRIDPSKAELLDLALKEEGFAAQQVWTRPAAPGTPPSSR